MALPGSVTTTESEMATVSDNVAPTNADEALRVHTDAGAANGVAGSEERGQLGGSETLSPGKERFDILKRSLSSARMRAIALSRGGANAVLIKGWEDIDHDGDDFMTKETFGAITVHLGIQWDVEAAWNQAMAIDADRAKRERGQPPEDGSQDNDRGGLLRVHQGDDQIHFTSYTSVFNVIMGAERRNHRLAVKLGFEKLQRSFGDSDAAAAGLNQRQVAHLVASCKEKLLLLKPPFDANRDWELMRKDGVRKVTRRATTLSRLPTLGFIDRTFSRSSSRSAAQYDASEDGGPQDYAARVAQGEPEPEPEPELEQLVDWNAFEEWWKLRMGLTETSVPVIPEYFSYKLKELGDKPRDPDDKTKARLWWELKRRIQLMVKMRQDWGQLQATYGQLESTIGRIPIMGWIIDPDSMFSTRWDMLQVVFLLYVTIFVPLRACFQYDVELFSTMWVVDTVVDLYFIVDLFLNCFTAFDHFGIRETRHKQIVIHYIRTWFFFDLVACVPVQYIAMAIESADSDSGKNLSIVKAIRLVRLSKMLRLTRIKRILAKYEDLMMVQQYQGVAVLAFAILFASHFLSCLWYLVGTGSYDRSYNRFKHEEGFELVQPEPVEGWVLQEWGNVTTQPDDLSDIPIGARYSSSMYYVFNALENGTTDAERLFGVFSFFVVVMIDGAVAGVLSAMMISMGGADREITDKLKEAKAWMKVNHVPHEETVTALQYLQQALKAKAVPGKDGVLSHMPPNMKAKFTKLLYAKTLSSVPLFRNLPDQVVSALSAIVKPMIAVKHQFIITEGSVGSEMYLILAGELEIKRANSRLGFVSAGGFFGEVPMLDNATVAEVRERSVIAMTDCRLVYLERNDMEVLKKRYPELALRMKQCARVGRNVNKKGKRFKDAARLSKLMLRSMPRESPAGGPSPALPDEGKIGPIASLSDGPPSELSEDVAHLHVEMSQMQARMVDLDNKVQQMSSSLEAKLSLILARLDTR